MSSPEVVVKNRFIGFLIWQSIPSTITFLFFKTFFLSPLSSHTVSTTTVKAPAGAFFFLFSFLTFHLSQLLFSASLSMLSSPQLNPPASPSQLVLAFLRFLFVSGAGYTFSSRDFLCRAKVSLSFILFVLAAAISGFLSAVAVCQGFDGMRLLGIVGFRGFTFGLLYALVYIYKQRWVLQFPIIQRPPFFRFKMGISASIKRALKLSCMSYLFSMVLSVFLPDHFKSQATIGKFIAEQIFLYIGSFSVLLCWELSHCLHEVLHTKRFKFAPPKGSAAAETNPSEPLLAALEESAPNSLPQYLAYLDLSMVCENNVDTWRRAAFFEETGETYKRVVSVSLRPLEQLTFKLSEGLEGCSVDKGYQLSNQLQSPTDPQIHSNYYELLNNYQQYAWCARTVASLTAHSHNEDSFGVAQLSGSNALVVSTLVSCILAVEAFMGKKMNLQAPHQLMGPAGIKWATPNTLRTDVMTKRRSGPVHPKAYALADVLRTSIYCIVSAFHDEMLASAKTGLLEKDWIINSKPTFGTQELLLQKLRLFLDFQAS